MRELSTPLKEQRRPVNMTAALSNPGLLYNAGNLIAVAGSVAFLLLLSVSHRGVTTHGFVSHFLGNWPALLTTIASLVFWIGGIQYAKAWSRGFPPIAIYNSRGHGLSTLGAVLIGAALIGMARTEVALALAIIATILHAGGKLASWQAPDADGYFKPMPLYSRIPYVTTLCLDMRSDVLTALTPGALLGNLVLQICLILATIFWARADWLLLPKKG